MPSAEFHRIWGCVTQGASLLSLQLDRKCAAHSLHHFCVVWSVFPFCACTLHSWSNLLVEAGLGGCSAHFTGKEEGSLLSELM